MRMPYKKKSMRRVERERKKKEPDGLPNGENIDRWCNFNPARSQLQKPAEENGKQEEGSRLKSIFVYRLYRMKELPKSVLLASRGCESNFCTSE